MHHVLDTRVGAWSVTESQVSYISLYPPLALLEMELICVCVVQPLYMHVVLFCSDHMYCKRAMGP